MRGGISQPSRQAVEECLGISRNLICTIGFTLDVFGKVPDHSRRVCRIGAAAKKVLVNTILWVRLSISLQPVSDERTLAAT